MSRANTVTIDHLEVRKTAIDKVKRFFIAPATKYINSPSLAGGD